MEKLGSVDLENQKPLTRNLTIGHTPPIDNEELDRILKVGNDTTPPEMSTKPNPDLVPASGNGEKSDSDKEALREEIISYGRIGIYALAKRVTESRIERKASKAEHLTEKVAAHARASELASLPYIRIGEDGTHYSHTRKRGETYTQFRTRTGLKNPTWVQGERAQKPNGKQIYKKEIEPNETLNKEYRRAGKRLRRHRKADLIQQKGVNLHEESKNIKARGKNLRSSRSLINKTRGVGLGIKGRYRFLQGKYHTTKGEILSNMFSPEPSRRRLEVRQERSIDGLKRQALRAKALNEHMGKLVHELHPPDTKPKDTPRQQPSTEKNYPPRPSRQNAVPVDRARSRKARTEWGKKWQEQQEVNRKGVI